MANGHGGSRPGAGRKSKRDQFPAIFEAVDQRLADGVEQRLATLEQLATEGTEIVHEVWEPAGQIVIDDLMTDSDTGKTVRVKRLAFPDVPADKLVLVQRKIIRQGPSETAAIYMTDRFLGKPTQHVEGEIDVESIAITEQARAVAAQELAAWRDQMIEHLSNTPNALLMPPTPVTPTE